MHPLQNGSQAETRPEKKPLSGLPGWFTESGENNVPSYPGQEWFNVTIAEFMNVLSVQGIAFDPQREDHLSRAFEFINNKIKATPTVSFIFDDATPGHAGVATQFEQEGFRAGFAINAPKYFDVSNRLTRLQLQTISSNGHEILNHGATHISLNVDGLDSVFVSAEIDTSHDILTSLNVPVFGWVSAYSTVKDEYLSLISRKHGFAYTVSDPDGGEFSQNSDPMKLSRFAIDDGNVQRFKDKIDSVISNSTHLCVYGHVVDNTVSLTPQVLGEMLSYCKGLVDEGKLIVTTPNLQVRGVLGAVNQVPLVIGSIVDYGSASWSASNPSSAVNKTFDSVDVTTSSVDDVAIWRIYPSSDLVEKGNTLTFSFELVASNLDVSIGYHFLNAAGQIISGYSRESAVFSILSGDVRRYSMTVACPASVHEIRPYVRIPASSLLSIRKPRLKIGLDSSEYGHLQVLSSKSNLIYKQELPAQTIPQGSFSSISLKDYSSVDFEISSNSIVAKRDISVYYNLYGLFSASDATITGYGGVFCQSPGNLSRHGMGALSITSAVGGAFSSEGMIVLKSGESASFSMLHRSDGSLVIDGDDPLVALDLTII